MTIEEAKLERPGGGAFGLIIFALVLDLVGYGILSNAYRESTAINIIGVIWFVLAVATYFSPSIIAYTYKHPRGNSIGLINFFLGWTLLGWVIALVWAYSPPGTPEELRKSIDTSADDTKECPHCAETIKAAAIKCRYCGEALG